VLLFTFALGIFFYPSSHILCGTAAFWIRIGMLCETHPGVTFQELVARELRAAGVDASVPTGAAA